MDESLKQKYFNWYNTRMVPKFWKAWTFLINVAGFLVATAPELINMLLSNINSGLDAVPTMAPMTKFYILMAVNVLSIVLKPIRQAPNSLAPATVEKPNADA